MQRRTFVAGTAGALGTLAGCATLGGGDSGGSSGPTAPVESFVDGYAANDSEATEAAIHPDGPLAEGLPRSVDDRQLELANATVVSEANGTATVEANLSVRGDGDRWHEPREFEVREREGEWAVWSMTIGPEIALRKYAGAIADGRTDDALTRLHPDSPDREWVGATVIESASLALESATLESLWADEAALDVAVTETVDGATTERNQQVELQRTAEGWRVWSLRFGPVVAAYDYASALDGSDPEILDATIHPESPQGNTDISAAVLEQFSVSVASVEIIEGPEGGAATVETELELGLAVGEDEQTETQSTELEVRTHEGEWLVYQ